jgi:hypothetical protein
MHVLGLNAYNLCTLRDNVNCICMNSFSLNHLYLSDHVSLVTIGSVFKITGSIGFNLKIPQ